jgi:hypothetical protein
MMNHRITPDKLGCDNESFEQLLEKAVDAFNDTEGDAVERVVAAARVVRTEALGEDGEKSVSAYEKMMIAIGYLLGNFQVRSLTTRILDAASDIKTKGSMPDNVLLSLLVNELCDHVLDESETSCDCCADRKPCKGPCGPDEDGGENG